jgi:CHAT domain-containing protein
VHLTRAVVDRARLVRTIERARASLELQAGDSVARLELARLYDWLVRPVEARLGTDGRPLVVVADGDVAAVPFAALYDAVRGRYLVERRVVRFAPTLREADRPTPAPAAGATTLLVADPAFDPRAFPALARLAGAAREAADVAAQYPTASVLAGAAASRAAVEGALGRAGVVHYAGHALFDDERPERSQLVLAATPDSAPALTAADVARLDLRHTRLVVLSACQTLRATAGRSGGFAGLAGAFLAAGAGGIVGSLWRVDDERTRALMVEFHRAYRTSGDGPAALREAQLRLLRSADAAMRSPAAWAGFRYAGS